MKYRLLFFYTLISFVFAGCRDNIDDDNNSNNQTIITIISTNDIHAQIENFPRLESLIEEKELEGHEVLVLNAGDMFLGNPYVDLNPEKGKPMITIMNELGYDVGCLGNHEFDYGQGVLRQRILEAEFPMLCANLTTSSSTLGTIEPFYKLSVGGIRFCFLGLIQLAEETNQPDSSPLNMEGLTFTNYRTVAPQYDYLDSECDAFIAITHLGLNDDYNLATIMPELDLIIGGHSHTYIDEEIFHNDVLITQSNSHLKYAGLTTLHFDENKELIDRTYELVDLNDYEEDSHIKAMVEEIHTECDFEITVGSASQKIEGKENIASFMTDAMAEIADADFAFYNKGGVRNSVIEAGDITMLNIFEIEPFSNEIQTVEMTLQEIKDFILRNYATTQRIDYYISEGRYDIITDDSKQVIDINIYDKDNNLLTDNNSVYTIALSNYVMAIDPEIGQGQSTGVLVTSAMIDYLSTHSPIYYSEPRAFINSLPNQ